MKGIYVFVLFLVCFGLSFEWMVFFEVCYVLVYKCNLVLKVFGFGDVKLFIFCFEVYKKMFYFFGF